jgi:hypothetical protein
MEVPSQIRTNLMWFRSILKLNQQFSIDLQKSPFFLKALWVNRVNGYGSIPVCTLPYEELRCKNRVHFCVFEKNVIEVLNIVGNALENVQINTDEINLVQLV